MPSKNERAFELWALIDLTRNAIYNARNKELAQYGLSVREVAIIRALKAIGEKATPTKIARAVYRSQNTAATMLIRMQKKGILRLYKDKEFKNLVRIEITEEGEKAFNAVWKKVSIYRIFKALDEDDWNNLEILLTRIKDAAIKQTGGNFQRYYL